MLVNLCSPRRKNPFIAPSGRMGVAGPSEIGDNCRTKPGLESRLGVLERRLDRLDLQRVAQALERPGDHEPEHTTVGRKWISARFVGNEPYVGS